MLEVFPARKPTKMVNITGNRRIASESGVRSLEPGIPGNVAVEGSPLFGADQHALYGDWCAIGGDIVSSIEAYDKEDP